MPGWCLLLSCQLSNIKLGFWFLSLHEFARPFCYRIWICSLKFIYRLSICSIHRLLSWLLTKIVYVIKLAGVLCLNIHYFLKFFSAPFVARLKHFLFIILQEQKFNKFVIDPTNGKDFERPSKSHVKSNDHAEKCTINNQASDPNNFESPLSSEEKPSL